ncbi:hypothetical protein SDC9_142477 [bioreactor metagenome]|uniref:Uncharacterized protein n=1 Tax=bioreactor metagenome TaxID=1076179 RepID=A0A645E3D9_9ZZZZ
MRLGIALFQFLQHVDRRHQNKRHRCKEVVDKRTARHQHPGQEVCENPDAEDLHRFIRRNLFVQPRP